MRKYFNTVISTTTGKPISGAQVRVKDSNGDLATLYSDDGGTALSNPVTTDPNGLFEFYAENGIYDFEFLFGGESLKTLDDVEISEDVTALQLASDDGADLVGFLQSGTDAVARTARAKLRDTLNAADFLPVGYVTDGSVDYTDESSAAVAEALASDRELVWPAGIFAANLVVVGGINGIRMRGQGHQATFIRPLSGIALSISGMHNDVSDMSFWGLYGGADTVKLTGLFARSTWNRVHIFQDDGAYCTWNGNGQEFVRNSFNECLFQTTATATQYAINLAAPGGLVNDNAWRSCIFQNSGTKHFLNIESTDANAAQFNNQIHAVEFEVCNGGGVRIRSGTFDIANCTNWDAPAVVNDFYDIGGNASSIPCAGAIRECEDRDSTFVAGKYSIALPASGLGAGIQIVNCKNMTMDAKGNGCLVVSADSAVALEITNGTGVTLIDSVNGEIDVPTSYRVAGTQVLGPQEAALPAVATDLPTALTLLNAMRATNIAHGLNAGP